MLEDKLKQLGAAIEAKRAEVSEKWTDFDAKRRELAEGDHDLTDPESEAVKAADDAMRPYSEAADQLRTLEGQFERLALMAADGGANSVDVRVENEHDRAEHRDLVKAFGQRVIESEAYKALRESGALADGSQQTIGRHEILAPGAVKADGTGAFGAGAGFKSLLTGTSDAAGGALNVPERFPGIYELPQLALGVLDLVTVGQTSSNAVEFVRILARTIAATGVTEASTHADVGSADASTTVDAAEAGVKPESGLTFQEALEAVRTIAHWIPATRNQLADAPFLRTLVESELLTGVERKAEQDIISGSGTAPQIRGILNTVGIVSHDQADNVGDTEIDAVHRLLTLIRLGGYEPSAVGFNPLDWENIRLAKDGNDNYIWGPPSQAGVMTVWGVRALSSVAFPEDKAVAGEWARALFLVREAARVLVTDSHKDWFVRNLLALLAEARGVLVVPRPQAFGECNFTA
jgi:HK97 family phage major capsid protein